MKIICKRMRFLIKKERKREYKMKLLCAYAQLHFLVFSFLKKESSWKLLFFSFKWSGRSFSCFLPMAAPLNKRKRKSVQEMKSWPTVVKRERESGSLQAQSKIGRSNSLSLTTCWLSGLPFLF